MRYQLLGPSGLRVSELCLGTMSFGEAWGFGADEKESHRILEGFAEAGGNFVDTADAYHQASPKRSWAASSGPTASAGWSGPSTPWPCAPAIPTPPGTRARTCASRWRPACGGSRPSTWTCCGCMPGTTPPRSRRSCVAWTTWWPRAGQLRRPVRRPRLGRVGGQHHGRPARLEPAVALQAEYSLIERTAERELPVAAAFGLSLTAWAPMGAGILTGKYTRGPTTTPEDSKRAAANQSRLSDRTAGSPARSTGSPASSAPPRPRWRSPGCAGATGGSSPSWASAPPCSDVLGCLEVDSRPPSAPAWTSRRIEYGFPYELLGEPQGQMVYSDLEPQIDLPPTAPIRWPRPVGGGPLGGVHGGQREPTGDAGRPGTQRGPWGDADRPVPMRAGHAGGAGLLGVRRRRGAVGVAARHRGADPGRGRLGRVRRAEARVPVPASVRVQIELVLYALAAVGLAAAGQPVAAVALGVAGLVTSLLNDAQERGRGRTSGGARARIGEWSAVGHREQLPVALDAPSWRVPRSARTRSEPATRSRTVRETTTSPAPASAMIRAARWTAIPPTSSRSSTSPACSRPGSGRRYRPAGRGGRPRSRSPAQGRRRWPGAHRRSSSRPAAPPLDQPAAQVVVDAEQLRQRRSPSSAARSVEATMSVNSTVASTLVLGAGWRTPVRNPRCGPA